MGTNGKVALLSVYNKTGIVEFARGLVEMGWQLIASGGTAKVLTEAGIKVRDVADLVGGGAILGHRVVTLSREIHAGLLATDSPKDVTELASLGIPRIDLVCVDMYPLEEAIAKDGATLESVIDMTDIGGPTMLRVAAKGRRIVVCDAEDRQGVLEWLRADRPNEETFLRGLAARAEYVVARYVATSAAYLGQGDYTALFGESATALCYGENKRQRAELFGLEGSLDDPLALHQFNLVEGGTPSFINYADVHRALETATRIAAGYERNFGFVPRLAVGVKHGNACGAASHGSVSHVTCRMVAGDPEAISGGVVLVNFPVDENIAYHLRRHETSGEQRRILDIVVAPSFTDGAIEELARRKTGKCRLFVNPALGELGLKSLDTGPRFRQVRGGFLRQDGDPFVLPLVLEWQLGEWERSDLLLAWAIGSSANSNTITLVKDGMLIGQGVGQQSRVMAAKLAVLRARLCGHSTHGAVAYSDSFFPFSDGPKVLADAGISAVFATSGSVRDEEVAKACKGWGVTLVTLPDAEARGFYGH